MQDLTRQGPAVDARLLLKFGLQFRREADVGRLIKCCHFMSPCYDSDIILHHNAGRCHLMIDEKIGTRWSNKPVMVQTDGRLVRLRKFCADRGLAYNTV